MSADLVWEDLIFLRISETDLLFSRIFALILFGERLADEDCREKEGLGLSVGDFKDFRLLMRSLIRLSPEVKKGAELT